MEIVVGPERREFGQKRGEFRVEGREKVESLIGAGACVRVRCEGGARGEVMAQGNGRVCRGEDGKAGDERARLAWRRGKIPRGEMEAREGLAGRACMGGGEKRRPGNRVPIEVDAGGNLVNFVS